MIERLLPSTVVGVESFGDVDGEPVFPGEESLVAAAVEGRRREFVTARRCARQALSELGLPPAPIGAGPRREPLWPTGVAGAITHCVGYRAAAVTRELAAVGIDAEPNAPLPAGVAGLITTAGEPTVLADLARGDSSIHWGRLLFSAKESVYKAWHPLVGRWLGFQEVELSIDPGAGTFQARLLTGDGPALMGFDGRFLIERGLILTTVTVA